MFIASLGISTLDEKKNEHFIRCAIFLNTHLNSKAGHARDTNKTTGNARFIFKPLDEIADAFD